MTASFLEKAVSTTSFDLKDDPMRAGVARVARGAVALSGMALAQPFVGASKFARKDTGIGTAFGGPDFERNRCHVWTPGEL